MTLVELHPDLMHVIDYIRIKHAAQKRIHGGLYYFHPMAVAELLMSQGITEKAILTAALLHDVLEQDAGVETTFHELEVEFSREIAMMVQGVTKPFKSKDDKRDKVDRNIPIYMGLRNAPLPSRWIKVYDRIHNLTEMKFAPRDFQKKYLLDTVILISALEEFVDDKHLNNLKEVFWQATKDFIATS